MKKIAIGLLLTAAVLPMAGGLVSLPGASQKLPEGVNMWGVSPVGAIPADLTR